MNKKWIPLGFYESNGTHFCVLARRGFFGSLRFRCKTVCGFGHNSNFVPPKIDVQKQWEALLEAPKKKKYRILRKIDGHVDIIEDADLFYKIIDSLMELDRAKAESMIDSGGTIEHKQYIFKIDGAHNE